MRNTQFVLQCFSHWAHGVFFLSNQFCHRSDEFFYRIDAFLERGFFFAGEFELDDLFDAASTENDRHADIISADAVFFVAVRGAGDEPLLVADDGFDHLRGRGGGSVVGAAGFQERDDFGAAVARAIDDFVEPLRVEQLRDRECRRRWCSWASAPSCRRGRP